jgi:hypothetical protein
VEFRRIIFASFITAFVLILSACGSLPRYQDAQAKYSLTYPEQISPARIIFLEPVFEGKAFDELVCDNAVGAMWSVEESKKIGFTQNYSETTSKFAPQMALLATLPGPAAIGLAASGQAGSFNISSRIMVPYGRFITANLRELLAAASPGTIVCLTSQCVQSNLVADRNMGLIIVKFSKLRVAEDKINTLTLVVEGSATMVLNGQSVRVPIGKSIINRSITSEGLFHSDVLRAMNKMANEITSSVAYQIYFATMPKA